jgi:hypothetical protein
MELIGMSGSRWRSGILSWIAKVSPYSYTCGFTRMALNPEHCTLLLGLSPDWSNSRFDDHSTPLMPLMPFSVHCRRSEAGFWLPSSVVRDMKYIAIQLYEDACRSLQESSPGPMATAERFHSDISRCLLRSGCMSFLVLLEVQVLLKLLNFNSLI